MESCKNCGKCFHVNWSVKDEVWKQVMNVSDESGGSLCVDCFIDIANKKGFRLSADDFNISLMLCWD